MTKQIFRLFRAFNKTVILRVEPEKPCRRSFATLRMTGVLLGALILIFLYSAPAWALVDGRVKNATAKERFGIVLARGVVNMVSLPLEFKRTVVHETEIHPKAWGFTVGPRMLTNFFLRFASAVNDTFIFPWYTPWTDDLSPWTEAFGLPDYPWQES